VEVFSTITSPLFSEIVIILGSRDIPGLLSRVVLFETLRAMNRIRPFKLVFSIPVSDFFQGEMRRIFLGEVRRKLTEALDSVAADGLLDFLDSPPTIRSTN